jgi:hypothetical protein
MARKERALRERKIKCYSLLLTFKPRSHRMHFFYEAMLRIALANKEEIRAIGKEIRSLDDTELFEKNLSFQEIEILLNATKEKAV